MEAMQRLLSVTIFRLTGRYWWSPWLIGIYYCLLVAAAFQTESAIVAEIMFVLYGFGLVYIVTLYGERAGFIWSVIAYGLYIYPVWNQLAEQLRRAEWETFVIDGVARPVGCFLVCIYMGRILVNSRKVTEEAQILYQRILELHQRSEKTLAGFILAMSRAIESKDPYTKGHSERVAAYSMLLAEKLDLPFDEKKQLFYGAVLHDIGKIGVPDSVLLKEGRLDPDEWVEMQLHPAIGKIVLEPVPGLEYVLEPVSLHHENLDGTGYPYGVKEDKIPLSARIVAIADAFDAMTSDRPYLKGMTPERALEELVKCSGTRYDRRLVDLFVEAMQKRDFRPMTKTDFEEYFRQITELNAIRQIR